MTGAPIPAQNNRQRALTTQRNLADEIWHVREQLAALGVHTDHRDIRLTRTATKPGGSYPTGGNTFWVEFLDSYFTDASGNQTPTHASRGIADGAHAHNVAGAYVTEGTVVLAVWQRGLNSADDGEWWFYATSFPMADKLYVVRFTLNATLSLGGTASATIQNCSDDAITEQGNPITVEDWIGKFKGRTGWRGSAYAYADDLEAGCNWTVIELEEQAEMIRATLTENMGASSANQAAANVLDYWQGESPGATYTVVDRCGAYANLKSGACVICSYDELDDVYVIIDPANPSAYEQCHATTGPGAVTGWINPAAAFQMGRLIANKDTFLRIFEDNASTDALISIDPSQYGHSVFWSDGAKVRWVRQPSFGFGLSTGHALAGMDGNGPPWWKQVSHPDDGGGDFWLGSKMQGSAEKAIWPNSLVNSGGYGAGSAMILKSTAFGDPSCIQLGWGGRGVDCSIELEDSAGEPVVLTIEHGIITNIKYGPTATTPDVDICTPDADPESATCDDTTETVFNPCP